MFIWVCEECLADFASSPRHCHVSIDFHLSKQHALSMWWSLGTSSFNRFESFFNCRSLVSVTERALNEFPFGCINLELILYRHSKSISAFSTIILYILISHHHSMPNLLSPPVPFLKTHRLYSFYVIDEFGQFIWLFSLLDSHRF